MILLNFDFVTAQLFLVIEILCHCIALGIIFGQVVKQNIAWVRIGMKKMILENLLDKIFDQNMRQIMIAFFKPGRAGFIKRHFFVHQMLDAFSRHGFIDQNLLRAVLRIDFGHFDDIKAVVEPVKFLAVLNLSRRIDLTKQRCTQLV